MKQLDELGEFTMLSIEDDVFNQELAVATFMDTPNINIYQAPNGEEGLKLIDEVPADIILLDLMMPKKSGLEVLEEIRKNPKYDPIPIIVVSSKWKEKRNIHKLGADDFVLKPYDPEDLKVRVFSHLRVKKFNDLIRLIKNRSGSKDTLEYLRDSVNTIDNSHKQLLGQIGNLAHGYMDENGSKRLGDYAKMLGHLYGLNSKEIENLYHCMSIYDIGLIRIPKEELESENSKIFRSHTELGVEILNGIEETSLISMAKKVVLYHHENWDGSGYPYGLSGPEIPIYAQIAGFVDFFDKLTTPRLYSKRVISAEDALSYIERESRLMFNPELVDIFSKNFDKFIEIKEKY